MRREWIIDDDVPIPPKRSGGGTATGMTDALKSMTVGQSVLIEDAQRNTIGGSISTTVRHWGGRYVSRAVKGGTRVWRVE